MRKVFVLLLFTLSLTAYSTTYYIDPSGQDASTRNGSKSYPWKTLAYACSRVRTSGDIIHVNSGTYHESVQSNLAIGVSIEGEGGNSHIISGISKLNTFTILLTASSEATDGRQHISNIKMDGNSLTAYGAIRVAYRKNVEIYNCTIINFNYYGVSFINGEPPSTYATGNKFHDNTVTNCGGYFDGNMGSLEIQGQDGMLVYNNNMTLNRSDGRNGDVIYGVEGFVKNVKIYNNVLSKTYIPGRTEWDFAIEFWNCLGGVEIYNNVITGSVDLVNSQRVTSTYSVWIHDNTIGQPTLLSAESVRGIVLETNQTDILIERNLIRNVAAGVFLDQMGSARTVSNLRINTNVFSNIGVSDAGENSKGWGILWTAESYKNHTVNIVSICNNVMVGHSGARSTMWGINLPHIGTSRNITIRNNIIRDFSFAPVYAYTQTGDETIDILSIENNIFYNNGNNNVPRYSGITPTHNTTRNNLTANPLFRSSSDFHLQSGSPAIGKGLRISDITKDFDGDTYNDPPSMGVQEYYIPAKPVYQSSVIENSSPAALDLSFNLSLATIIPPASAFIVQVNSVTRSINSVALSGTKVRLTLSSAVMAGDVITLTYTKPASNPIQTLAGGQADSFSTKPVTNNVIPASPVYSGSVIENLTPSLLEMTYSLSLANVVPAASSFNVQVNSVARNVTSIGISGTKVRLTLSSAVVGGDIVTVSYTKPASNPIQTPSGGQAANISAKPVTNNVISVIPVYSVSVIENLTPSLLEMTYSLSLANVVPAASSFNVQVNSVARNVTSVGISGTKVRLTLSSAVVGGDIVTVSYSKPASNPIQTPSGGQAANISAKPVTNNVMSVIPVYSVSVIENLTPSLLEMTYSLSLANVIPAASSFNVQVNSTARTVSSVAISGNKVSLTLPAPVKFSDIVTVSYTRPATNPLQGTSGSPVANITAKPVTNKVADIPKPNDPPTVVITNEAAYYSGFVGQIDASGTYDLNSDPLTYEWTVPADVQVSSTTMSVIEFLSPKVTSTDTIHFQLKVSDGTSAVTKNVSVSIMPYKPEIPRVRIAEAEASDYEAANYPRNVLDGDPASHWSVTGDNQWLLLKQTELTEISHIEISFLNGQRYSSTFDIYGSPDNVTWEPVLINVSSCGFSGNPQVFVFPSSLTTTKFSYIKLIGHGNSQDEMNVISEFITFGFEAKGHTGQSAVIIYPNPARNYFTISVTDDMIFPDTVRLYDLSGKLVFENFYESGLINVQLPPEIKSGIYIVHLSSGQLTLHAQQIVVDR